MWINALMVILGGAVLVGGGEMLVRGATALARTLGVSAMIVGLTVVAYGTSAPELAVSVLAAYSEKPGICGGNVVGSNILNVLLVLGVTGVIYPIQAAAGFVKREVPIMVGVSVLFFAMVLNGRLSRFQAGFLVLVLIGYTLLTIRIARREKKKVAAEYEDVQAAAKGRSLALSIVFIAIGLALLAGGSELFLRGAVGVAKSFGISDAIIGLTLVALGTSFPELAACLVAAYRKHPDICLGNIIGSSIYNLLAIAGLAGILAPLPFEPEMVRVHIPVMVGAAVVLWVIVARRFRISRRSGLILLALYAAYMGWTVYRHV